MFRVLVVDDDALVGEGIASLLTREGFEVVGVAASAEEALSYARSAGPDVVLADIMLGGEPEGLRLPRLLARAAIDVPVIFVSSYALPDFIERARRVGGRGFLPKSAQLSQLVAVIQGAVAGMESFPVLDHRVPPAPTDRERDVLDLVATGLSHHEVAGRLEISNRTVDGHMQRMYERYDVDSRSAMLALALRMGWIDPLATTRSDHGSARSLDHPSSA
jgi:DNA-binding NarL/FixJ family response regulator